MARLKDLLGEILRIAGTQIVVIVGRDGFVIEEVSNTEEIEFETVGAVLSNEIRSLESMGGELGVGKATQGLVEFEDGVIVTSVLNEDAILAVVSNSKANLGNIRFQVKKRKSAVQDAL